MNQNFPNQGYGYGYGQQNYPPPQQNQQQFYNNGMDPNFQYQQYYQQQQPFPLQNFQNAPPKDQFTQQIPRNTPGKFKGKQNVLPPQQQQQQNYQQPSGKFQQTQQDFTKNNFQNSNQFYNNSTPQQQYPMQYPNPPLPPEPNPSFQQDASGPGNKKKIVGKFKGKQGGFGQKGPQTQRGSFGVNDNYNVNANMPNFNQSTYSATQIQTPSTFTGFEYQQQYQTMTHQPPPGWQQQQMEQSSSNKFKKIEGKGAASTINKPNSNFTNQFKSNQGNSSTYITAAPQVDVQLKVSHQESYQTQMQVEKTEFDLQFEKWENEFENWKRENANHPDRMAYDRYAQEFEKVRVQLLKRRNEMRQKMMAPPSPPPDPAKDLQRKSFESQWNASTKIANQEPSTSTQSSFSRGAFSEGGNNLNFNQSLNEFMSTSQIDFQSDSIENFDVFGEQLKTKSDNLESLFNSNRSSIPFLDSSIQPEKEKPKVEEKPKFPIVVLDGYEDDENQDNDDGDKNFEFPPEKASSTAETPPMPKFTIPGENKEIIDIRKLLDPPARYDRVDKIVIFIRGAPGSGKTHLARLILEKERKINQNRSIFLSIHKYTRKWSFERDLAAKYIESLVEDMKNSLKTRKYNFVVVEIEGISILDIKKLASVSGGMQFKNYLIEIHQPVEVCRKYNVNERSFDDIENAVNGICYPQNRPPYKMCLIDPTYLLDPNFKEETKEIDRPSVDTSAISNIDISQILANKNVLELVQSQMKTNLPSEVSPQISVKTPQMQPTSINIPKPAVTNIIPQNSNQMQHQSMPVMNQLSMQNFNYQPPPVQPPPVIVLPPVEAPIYVPNKTIEYAHKHVSTLEEQMMEFNIFRVVDYKHKMTKTLYEFVKDIDLDKIIERKKVILLRKKTLNYLKNAERPEDTVSNPKYPKNWETIEQVDRPPAKTKRGKKRTAKILRIVTKLYPPKMRKLEELTEDISDDEDMMNKMEEDDDVTKSWTIPNFKKSDKKMQSVKEILNYPARLVRPRQIMIILRGAPGSGKSHLAQLIKKKEKEMQNEDVRILSINDYYESNCDSDDENSSENVITLEMIHKFLDQMVKQLERTIKDEFNFIVIDAENCDLKYYNIFHTLGMRKFYSIFTIELHQTPEICVKQNKLCKFKRNENEIFEAIETMRKNVLTQTHTLVDPTSLYEEYKCLVNKKILSMMDLEEVSDDEKFSDDDNMFEELPNDPKIPNFNWHSRTKNIRNIKELLEDPGRKRRPAKIMIILRGPAGSGKSYLTGLIRKKEIEKGAGDKFLALSIDDYFIDKSTLNYRYNAYALNENQGAMIKSLREVLRKNSHQFIVIDAENSTLEEYNQYHGIGTSNGFKCYAIELHQKIEICKTQNAHDRPLRDIENVLDDMKLNPLSENHILLNPSYLYSLYFEVEVPKQQPKIDITIKRTLPLMIKGEVINIESRKIKLPEFNWQNRDTIEIGDILQNDLNNVKIFVVLRGTWGSGKSYLASLIAQKQIAKGNKETFEVISFDDQFSHVEKIDSKEYLIYEYKSDQYDVYMEKMVKNFEEVVKRKERNFVVIDADNCDLKWYNRFYKVGLENGYVGYTIELNQDEDICILCNDHKISEDEIREKISAIRDYPISSNHNLVDPESLYHSDDEFFESLSDNEEDYEATFGPLKKSSTSSKWDDVDQQDLMIDKLDGTKNKILSKMTMAEYLRNEDEWTMRPSTTSGKKRVRWADIEEKKEQERMRQVGFIVGQTDWNRMIDTSDGRNALEKTRYIEPRNK